MSEITVHLGDSRDVLKTLADNSIDSVVTDPPYALVSIGKRFGADNAAPAKPGKSGAYARASAGFMGKRWDTGETAFAVEFWAEVMRVLKPGGHVVAFSGTRTYHRLACAVEDAGFEIRDMVAWLYGSGFPKSHDVSKGIDKAAGAVREITREASVADDYRPDHIDMDPRSSTDRERRDTPATDAARQWQGWGTALKPALEPVVLARKPLRAACVDMVSVLEDALRARGVEGDILWTQGPAKDADKPKSTKNSGKTKHRKTVETSAKSAKDLGTQVTDPEIEKCIASPLGGGKKTTLIGQNQNENEETNLSEAKSSLDTDLTASAAGKPKETFSLSTTSMEGARSTENQSTEKSILNSSDLDSLTDTESFVGIATGLHGSMAIVHIIQNRDGTFVWPEGLPEMVEGKSQTVAGNVLEFGTGAINVDGCRVGKRDKPKITDPKKTSGTYGVIDSPGGKLLPEARWPANLIHDGEPETIANFPDNASRFFYTAKADATERLGSKHPTVKPTDLMAYLIRLVTPPGGTTLDPFAGSGSTGVAAVFAGFNAVLIEREPEYHADILRRIAWAKGEGGLTMTQKRIPAPRKNSDGDLFS